MKSIMNWIVALAAVFAPEKGALIAALVLVVTDLISGIMAARKAGQPITSAGLKRTVGKLLLYEVAILLGFLAQTYLTGNYLPVCSLVTTVVGLTELKSILENMDQIYGGSLWKNLIDKITQREQL